ncbi:hypothetical protein ACQ4PT_004142 [Festuca glaucescens]
MEKATTATPSSFSPSSMDNADTIVGSTPSVAALIFILRAFAEIWESQRGPKVFMQSNCAACHSMLPYAGLREAAAAHGPLVAQAAEIVVAEEAQPPALARPLYGRAPDITTIATKIQDGLRCNLYSTGGDAVCQELKRKMAPPSSVWMQFAQPYLRPFQAA